MVFPSLNRVVPDNFLNTAENVEVSRHLLLQIEMFQRYENIDESFNDFLLVGQLIEFLRDGFYFLLQLDGDVHQIEVVYLLNFVVDGL